MEENIFETMRHIRDNLNKLNVPICPWCFSTEIDSKLPELEPYKGLPIFAVHYVYDDERKTIQLVINKEDLNKLAVIPNEIIRMPCPNCLKDYYMIYDEFDNHVYTSRYHVNLHKREVPF